MSKFTGKIRLTGVSKEYVDAERKLTILNEVDFEFPERGRVAIVGRSGVGKSTLLHLLGGLDTPTSGKVKYGDTVISSLSSAARAAFRRSNIGFIFQGHSLLPEFSALENVAMPLFLTGETKDNAFTTARSSLEKVGLGPRMEHRPGQLSGGEQQRVAIARSLVGEPPVILADEPTGSLDVETAAAVQKMLLEVCSAKNTLLIVVTHNLELAKSMDYVFEMLPGGRLSSDVSLGRN